MKPYSTHTALSLVEDTIMEIWLGKVVILVKSVFYFGQSVVVACDARCDKAWGIADRPRRQLSEESDDFEWLADSELGEAPEHPGTWEGEHTKPTTPDERLNKWCVRACERSVMCRPGETLRLPDFSNRVRNIERG